MEHINSREVPSDSGVTEALNFVYGEMAAHRGARGENPLAAVNTERLISAVRLLADRDNHEVNRLTSDSAFDVTGASYAPIDYSSAGDLTALYSKADGVFVHVPMGPPSAQLEFVRVVLSALREAQPPRVVMSTSGTTSPGADSGPVGVLARGLAETSIPIAVLDPRIFLENLLMPPLMDAVKDEGVLRYPVADDYKVSWASHLDVAAVAVELLVRRREVTGTVGVGALPALRGADLASAFSAYLGRDVQFEALTPDGFEDRVRPVFGPGASAVADFYRERAHWASDAIDPETSAQKILDLHPRSVEQWLRDIRA